MIGAAFMSLGIWRYLNQPLGFEIEDRVSVVIDARSVTSHGAPIDWNHVAEVVRGVPGIAAAGLDDTSSVGRIDVGAANSPDSPYAVSVMHGYFDAWGIRPTAGRSFHAGEFDGSARVAVVDEKLARVAWPDQTPIGKTIRTAAGASYEVIGVIPPERRRLAVELPGKAYLPASRVQERSPWLVAWIPGTDAAELAPRLTQALTAAIPGVKVQLMPVTLERLFSRDLGEAVFQQPIVAMFGIFTFALAAVGVFGLVSYLAEQRRREFGIRIALGARPGHLWQEVLRQGLVPAVLGLGVGLGIAGLLETIVEASVFGRIERYDATREALIVLPIAVYSEGSATEQRELEALD